MGIFRWILECIEGATETTSWFRGISTCSKWLLRRMSRRVMGRGIEFFPDRLTLERHRTLTEMLSTASERGVDAVWVVGQKQINIGKELHRLHRLILPNPNSESLQQYQKTMEHQTPISSLIPEVTERAKKAGIKVKWYPDFVGHSLMIADKGKDTGWVHIETVLPFSKSDERPSITVQKNKHPDLFNHFVNVFTDMWDASDDPDNINMRTTSDELKEQAEAIKNDPELNETFIGLTNSHNTVVEEPNKEELSDYRVFKYLIDNKLIRPCSDNDEPQCYQASEEGWKLRRAHDRFSDNREI